MTEEEFVAMHVGRIEGEAKQNKLKPPEPLTISQVGVSVPKHCSTARVLELMWGKYRESGNRLVRARILADIGLIGGRGAIEYLRDASNETDDLIRSIAISGIAVNGDSSDITLLYEHLDDKDSEVAWRALEGLRILTGRDFPFQDLQEEEDPIEKAKDYYKTAYEELKSANGSGGF